MRLRTLLEKIDAIKTANVQVKDTALTVDGAKVKAAAKSSTKSITYGKFLEMESRMVSKLSIVQIRLFMINSGKL